MWIGIVTQRGDSSKADWPVAFDAGRARAARDGRDRSVGGYDRQAAESQIVVRHLSKTFHVLGEIYAVRPPDLKRTLGELVELLEMQDLLTKPVRDFSLGERMKCELVAGLLRRPEVLFLDEPTLGLDVSMQGRLRRYNSPSS
jgi:ABC-type Na+ transport system ATPase subunit NatA